MPSFFEKEREEFLRIFEGWTGKPAHPDSPAGGGGPGSFRQPGPLNHVHVHGRLPHPHSPAGRRITHLDIAKALATRDIYKEHPGAVNDPLSLVDTDKVGNGQCAILLRVYAKAPPSIPNGWSKGTQLTSANVLDIKIGTSVASGWDKNGYYPHGNTGQHSGIFAGPEKDKDGKVVGFKIVEQYDNANKIKLRSVYFDPKSRHKKDTYFSNAHNYATVRWKDK